jgi:hypothetical protein
MRRFSAPSCRRPRCRAVSSPRSPGGLRSPPSPVFSQTIRLSEWDQSTPEPGLADHGGKVVQERVTRAKRARMLTQAKAAPPGSRLDLSGTRGVHHPMIRTAAVDAPCLVGRSGSPRAARYDRDATPKLRGKVGPTTTGPWCRERQTVDSVLRLCPVGCFLLGACSRRVRQCCRRFLSLDSSECLVDEFMWTDSTAQRSCQQWPPLSCRCRDRHLAEAAGGGKSLPAAIVARRGASVSLASAGGFGPILVSRCARAETDVQSAQTRASPRDRECRLAKHTWATSMRRIGKGLHRTLLLRGLSAEDPWGRCSRPERGITSPLPPSRVLDGRPG